MKTIFYITTLLVSSSIYSQKKGKIFQPDFANYTIQCGKVGSKIIDKTTKIDITKYYEGTKLNELIEQLSKFEIEIDKTDFEITYDLILLNETPMIYSFDFRKKGSKENFGQIYIRFKNRKNYLIDDLKVVSKSEMEKIETESKEITDLPKPPLPPTSSK